MPAEGLEPPTPAPPRHNYGTPKLCSAQARHIAGRRRSDARGSIADGPLRPSDHGTCKAGQRDESIPPGFHRSFHRSSPGHFGRPFTAGPRAQPQSSRKLGIADAGLAHRGPRRRRQPRRHAHGQRQAGLGPYSIVRLGDLYERRENPRRQQIHPLRHANYATAAAKAANRSPGNGLCSRQVIAIGCSDSCFT